jgi:hypothetical protein
MQLVHNDAYTSHTGSRPIFPRRALALLSLWLFGAVVAVASGAFARAPAPVLPLTVVGLTAVSVGALLADRAGRAWADTVSKASLAWFHVWRAAPGAAFLVLYAHGSLPWGFAVPGGMGDLAIALTAPLAAWAAGRNDRGARRGYLAWNVLGFLDLANVVREAVQHTLADPGSMHLLRELPLGLLPTFAVPLSFAAHALALRRRGGR